MTYVRYASCYNVDPDGDTSIKQPQPYPNFLPPGSTRSRLYEGIIYTASIVLASSFVRHRIMHLTACSCCPWAPKVILHELYTGRRQQCMFSYWTRVYPSVNAQHCENTTQHGSSSHHYARCAQPCLLHCTTPPSPPCKTRPWVYNLYAAITLVQPTYKWHCYRLPCTDDCLVPRTGPSHFRNFHRTLSHKR